jgi:hypothetical protein
MRLGTYCFFQALRHLTHADVIQREMAQMVWTEAQGFDSVWPTEHHFIEYGLSDSPAGGLPQERVRHSMELFAREVMPQFRGARGMENTS